MYTVEVIENSKKFGTVEDILTYFYPICDLLKDDVFKICKAKNIYLADFEASYAVAVQQTKLTLDKKYLKAIKKFYKCKNVKSAINFLIQRILNNMKNAGNTKHKFAFKPPKFGDFDINNISNTYVLDEEIEIENLQKLDKETLKKGLKRVWEEAKFDEDFDLEDLKNLCSKYNINLYNVIKKEELESPNFGSYELKNGTKQTFLVF